MPDKLPGRHETKNQQKEGIDLLQHPPQLKELAEKLTRIQKNYPGAVSLAPPQDNLITKHTEERKPWLEILSLEPQENELRDFYDKLKDVLVSYETFSFLEKLDLQAVAPLARSYLHREVETINLAATAAGANKASYLFFLRELMRPWAKSATKVLRSGLRHEKWLLNFCPICGHLPAGARQEKVEGKRFLICSLCETEWLFNRMTCPQCGNDDHTTLGYFTVEGIEDWKVSFCRKCNTYFKEIITNEPVSVFDLELNVQLDLLARGEGFQPLGGE